MYSKDLKLDFNLDIDPLIVTQRLYTSLNSGAIFKLKISEIDPKFIHFLNEHNLTVSHAELFYTPPDKTLFIHIDWHQYSNNCKINWIFGGENSLMKWWELKDPNAPLTYRLTDIGTRYLYFNESDCNEIASAVIGQPSLVNVGVPHSVDNRGCSARWCLSYVIWDLNKNNVLQWDDALVKFSKYIDN